MIKTTVKQALTITNRTLLKRPAVSNVYQTSSVLLLQQQKKLFHISNVVRQQQQEQKQEQKQEETTQTQQKSEEKKTEQASQKSEAELKIEQLTKELAEKEAKLKETEERYVGSLRDQENTRRIARLDVDKAKLYGIQNFAKSLVDVADNLRRATSLIQTDAIQQLLQPQEQAGHIPEKVVKNLSTIFQGISMTEGNLSRALNAHGVARIETPIGSKFDPNVHEAMMKLPSQDFTANPPQTIASIISEGYTINERVLRPVRVAVYVDPNDE